MSNFKITDKTQLHYPLETGWAIGSNWTDVAGDSALIRTDASIAHHPMMIDEDADWYANNRPNAMKQLAIVNLHYYLRICGSHVFNRQRSIDLARRSWEP